MSSVTDVLRNRVDYLSDAYRVDGGALGLLRILFGLQVILFPVDYTWAARVPSAFFHSTPGIASVFAAVPPLGFLILLEVIQACLAIFLILGYQTVFVSFALTAVMMIGSSIVHSFSKIDHFILLELFPLAMAAAGWGAALSLDARHRRKAQPTRGFPILLWAVTVAFALFTAGLPKAISGWLDPSRQASRTFLAHDLTNPVKVGPLAETVFSLDHALFWKAIDYATVFVEVWLIFALFVPVLFRIGIFFALAFHSGVYLILGIDFAHYFLVYVVFFCSSPQAMRVLGRLRNNKGLVYTRGETHVGRAQG